MVFTATGSFMLFLGEVLAGMRDTPPRIRDILEQVLAAFRLGWRPVIAVSAPFGMAFAFNFDSLLGAVGARAMAGGAIAPSVVRQGGPLVSAVIVTAVVGAAFCADLGARKVRDELSASQVMAVNPLPRLVLPRILGTTIATPFLYLFGVGSGLLGAYVLLVVVRTANVGAFLQGLRTLLTTIDIVIAFGKTIIFGLVIGSIACFYGCQAEGGPAGVASKVRSSIIVSIVIVFFIDYGITSFFYVQ